MIIYSCIGLFDGRKRFTKRRRSDKNRRVYDKLSKYKKIWWHYRTKWDPKDNDTD